MGCGADDSIAGAARYENPTVSFSFEYPDSFDVREYSPSFVAIGSEEGEAFDAVVEVGVEEGEGASFQDFAIERARLACAADGPNLSLQCTDVEMLQPVTTGEGREGISFYLKHVATRPGSGEVVATDGRGPFFAFELESREAEGGTNSQYEMLIVRAPVVLEPDQVNAELVRRIARSLRVSRPVEFP
ncbi:MAG TPA: hypothetical protein VF187_01405 [Gemmatimonadales bacterium]